MDRNLEKEIKVSIYCLAYNHEKYIRDTLEGFVNQKTNFAFEAIVHDDASTDGTRLIIQEYAEKYPNIVKPIFQTENQHSKGIKIVKTFVYPKMRGEYVAICEGDDYWCDKNKLQRQVDFLEENPEYSACVHNTEVLDLYRNQTRIFNDSKQQYDLDINHVLSEGGADYHTSSLVYRMKYAQIINSDNPPDFYYKPKRVGDYPLAIYLSLEGKINFFPEIMSVYRLGTPGSWTKSMENPEALKAMWFSLIEMLKSVDEYTDYRLHSTIEKVIDDKYLHILEKEEDSTMIKVDAVRSIKKAALIFPNEGEKSVFIIREAQYMNPQAQNALLKIFEEPSKHVCFILTCPSKSSFLETIISRATAYSLGEEECGIVKDNMAQKGNEIANELLSVFISSSEFFFLQKTAIFQKDKPLFKAVLNGAVPIIRDALIFQSGGKELISEFPETAKRIASALTQKKVLGLFSGIRELSDAVNASANHNLSITRFSALLYGIKSH